MLPTDEDKIENSIGLFTLLNARVDSDGFQAEKARRAAMIRAARDYFDGYHPKPLKVREGDKDSNVIINLCRILITKSVAWLFGDPENGEAIKFTIKQADQPKAEVESVGLGEQGQSQTEEHEPTNSKDPAIEKAEQWLSDVWDKNGGAQFLLKLGRRCGITGHGFIKILPANEPSNDLGVPRLVLQKTELMSVVRKQDDSETAEAFVIEWKEKRLVNTRLRDVTVRQIITKIVEKWVIGQFVDTGRGEAKWQPDGPIVTWPYSWCPIVDWQNLTSDAYYGESDLEDLPTLNDAINFTASNVNRILFIHGHPRTVGTGFEAGELQDTAVDSFWTIANPNAKVNNLEMQSDLKAAFGFLQYITQSFWDVGRELDLASLRDRIGQITNFGLRVLANNALSKLGEKRLNYGKALKEINSILLELGGFEVRDTEIHWLHPLPEDATEEVTRLQTELDMQIVSKQTAAEERGRDWTQEQERRDQEETAEGNIGGALLGAFEKGQSFKPLRSARLRKLIRPGANNDDQDGR